MERNKFNPKRRLRQAMSMEEAQRLAAARYEGSPYHKRSPGDFGLDPPSAARPGKTLCDRAGIFRRSEAEQLLQEGIQHGWVSVAEKNGWPNQIWAVSSSGVPLEAQGDESGAYHGYPLAENDPFAQQILARWKK